MASKPGSRSPSPTRSRLSRRLPPSCARRRRRRTPAATRAARRTRTPPPKDRSGAAAGTRRHPARPTTTRPRDPRGPRRRALPYLPWTIRARPSAPCPAPAAPTRRGRRTPPGTGRGRPRPTRRGPLREEDLPATPADAFVYPQCRLRACPAPAAQAHVQRGTASPGSRSSSTTCTGAARPGGPGVRGAHLLPPRRPATPAGRDGRARARARTKGDGGGGVLRRGRRVQTLRVDDEEARVEDDEDEEGDGGGGAATKPRRKKGRGGKPLPPPLPPVRRRSQRHFRGHADDVRCLTVHETTRLAASGDMGVEPCVMVWCVDERGGHPLARLRHPGSRARHRRVLRRRGRPRRDRVRRRRPHREPLALGRGRAGVPVSGRVVVEDRARALVRASYQTTPPAVKGLAFTPDPLAPDLLVSFGTTHVRFWTPETDVPVPDGEVGSAEAHQAALRRPWRTRAGKNVRPEDVRCGVFLPWRVADEDSAALVARSGPLVDDGEPTIPPAEEGLSRGVNFVTGSPRGALLFWEKGDGSVPARAIAGSRHRAAVNALALSPSRRHQGSPRLLSPATPQARSCAGRCAPAPGPWSRRSEGCGSWRRPRSASRRRRAYPPSVASSEIWLESDLENDASTRRRRAVA